MPKTQSLFYGPSRDETRFEKQLRERAEKKAEYEENFMRQNEIYKAKRKREEEELKNRYNYIKSRTSNNFYPINHKKEKSNDEFLKLFKNITKIDYPKDDIRNYECNPQKYDKIIHSLLSEISEIKFQRKKENEEFINQIKKLQNDLDDNKNKKLMKNKRPKTGNKGKYSKKKNNKNNALNNIINNYYKPYKQRPKTGNKLKNKNNSNLNQKVIENEIPVNNNNSSKNKTLNNDYKKEKEKLLKNYQDLEIKKNIKINELNEIRNNINNINTNNNSYNFIYDNNNFNNINDKNNYIKNISKSVNVNILYPNMKYQNPPKSNNIDLIKNVNYIFFNYQEKIQILNELNNNISKFTSGIPKLVNKVNQTLEKIYGHTDNPIKKAINNHPFVILASKTNYQMIQNNSEIIIEKMIDDLLIDCVFDLQFIDYERKKIQKKKYLNNYIYEANKVINKIIQNEKEILKKYLNEKK